MENGHGGNLSDKFSGLALNDKGNDSNNNNDNSDNESLLQVMKAVEAAEATIKQQVEENNRLKTELLIKGQELERYKLESIGQRPHGDAWKESLRGPYEVHQLVPSINNLEERIKTLGNISAIDPSSTLVLRPDLKPNAEDAALQIRSDIRSEGSKNNGTVKILSGGLVHGDIPGPSQLSSPSTSFSPTRYQLDGESDPRFNLSGQGLMPMAEVNNPSSLWKQDLVLKVQEHEEEIMQLQKHLSEYSIKEAQIRNEKYILENRIAYMRLAFDQQQQDLVDAASKALSYRQDIIEENIHLTYQLQAAQQERTTFVQSLLPLLVEYSLQPPAPEAKSIVSNVKVLFKHLQEKLILTESKLKESQYQLAPWLPDLNNSSVAPQLHSHFTSAGLVTSNNNGLELVARPTYSHGKIPTNSDAQEPSDWDLSHQQDELGAVGKNLGDDMRRYSPLASRDSAIQSIPAQLASTHDNQHAAQYGEETANKQVKFRVPVSSSGMDDHDTEEHQSESNHSSNWPPGNSPYGTTLDDPNSTYSPYLPPVLEEPSSSFSEAADDDPLPAIEDLQITGEAFPGKAIEACGFSINGTTSCNFEWVRHMEDGSVKYIEGAKQPSYLVTADDVDTYLAIEVQPLDDQKRKGELVRVFANDQRKITCDSDMRNHIEKTIYSSHASYGVSVSTRYLDIWEPATLAIKREGYSIKGTGPSGLVVTEKFSPTTSVTIPYGTAKEFVIAGSSGNDQLLRAEGPSTDVSCSRETIVLTLRWFIRRASEKRKGRKRGLFFHK